MEKNWKKNVYSGPLPCCPLTLISFFSSMFIVVISNLFSLLVISLQAKSNLLNLVFFFFCLVWFCFCIYFLGLQFSFSFSFCLSSLRFSASIKFHIFLMFFLNTKPFQGNFFYFFNFAFVQIRLSSVAQISSSLLSTHPSLFSYFQTTHFIQGSNVPS